MTRKITAFLSPFLIAGTMALPALAQSGSVADQSMLSVLEGPGIDNDVLTTLPEDADFDVNGCLEDGTWCAITAGKTQGWVAGDAIEVDLASVPTITFDWSHPLIIEVEDKVVPVSE